MSDDRIAPAELPLLVGRGAGEPETLLLLGAPADGRVTVRRWSADNWSATPTSTSDDAAELLRWIEAQAAAGRTLNQSLYDVRLWLRGIGVAPRTR